uniref:Transmembrane protein n=1 Tax=Craspedostauros australis TaxID=1486917 RepID=A0A7S0F7B3_9STRA|mmetsp:Transcript_9525/g.25921  ORF Transcript_9525/g.25921 Transcript_9525/m.25921 type:complete len:292 (+) Transcript_9525:198-1073(+)|eukprot:CAMPEP_0198112350 /NCGR_PEP_ID=MMETSP1442-20131203/4209_1 /TAXON_ID= /ORGANISM="Craspedostauros australis, Strain CCMP3328" /LENGTH=291 /DNA_ID=CAMNT_0043769081 /DNA_START=158 /DNA_END=1033 /DNA_ORIENTATION=+
MGNPSQITLGEVFGVEMVHHSEASSLVSPPETTDVENGNSIPTSGAQNNDSQPLDAASNHSHSASLQAGSTDALILRKPSRPEHTREIRRYEERMGRILTATEVSQVVKLCDAEFPPLRRPTTPEHREAVREWEGRLGYKLSDEEVDRVLQNLVIQSDGYAGNKFVRSWSRGHKNTMCLMLAQMIVIVVAMAEQYSPVLSLVVPLFEFAWCLRVMKNQAMVRLMKQLMVNNDNGNVNPDATHRATYIAAVLWTIIVKLFLVSYHVFRTQSDTLVAQPQAAYDPQPDPDHWH